MTAAIRRPARWLGLPPWMRRTDDVLRRYRDPADAVVAAAVVADAVRDQDPGRVQAELSALAWEAPGAAAQIIVVLASRVPTEALGIAARGAEASGVSGGAA